MTRGYRPSRFRRIEHEVEFLLSEHAQKTNRKIQPPIPVEDIAEKHLCLNIQIDNLQAYGDKVIGLLVPQEKLILIDERCSENQFLFTVSHEIGHWCMHAKTGTRNSFLDRPESLFSFSRAKRSRSREIANIEAEANQFAAALLIPRRVFIRLAAGYGFLDDFAIVNLAKRFSASLETMLYRALYLESHGENLGVPVDRKSLDLLESSLT